MLVSERDGDPKVQVHNCNHHQDAAIAQSSRANIALLKDGKHSPLSKMLPELDVGETIYLEFVLATFYR